MMEIGDCFRYKNNFDYIFKVIKFLSLNLVECEVYFLDRKVNVSNEHKSTLLKMRKLTELEKELM
jgi:hypothetical protein